MKIKSIFRVLLTLLLILALLPTGAAAKEQNDPVASGALQIPAEMDFVFHDTCSGHDYFYHVAFREDGWFAVFYRTAIDRLHDDEYLSRIYVDIFDDRGEFQREISFKSQYDIALELTETLNIYCYDYMIAYDWVSDALQIETIPDNYAHTSDIYADFSRKEIELGDWIYTCERTLMGYCTIKRTNGEQEETLLSLSGDIPGMNVSLESRVVVAIIAHIVIVCVAGVVIYFFVRKRKNRR